MSVTVPEVCRNILESKVFECGPNAIRVFIGLLAVKESQILFPSWNNQYKGAVSICVSALARNYANLTNEECIHGIEELKSCGLLVGKEPHWGISHCDSYYRRREEMLPRRIPIPEDVRQKVLSSGKCAFCGSPERLQVDHIIPVARGGSSNPSNLQPLCAPCNQSKGAKLLSDKQPKTKTNGIPKS